MTGSRKWHIVTGISIPVIVLGVVFILSMFISACHIYSAGFPDPHVNEDYWQNEENDFGD